MEHGEQLTWCRDWISKINQDFSILNNIRADNLKFVNSNPAIVPYVEGRSKLTTTDTLDMIETIKPDLLEIFAGSDDIVSIQPEEESDTEGVKRQEILVNKQLKTKNNWYLLVNDILDDALKFRTGGVKWRWKKETKIIEKQYEGLTDDEFAAKLNQPDTEITEHSENVLSEALTDPINGMVITPQVKEHNIKIKISVHDEFPQLESIPAEELGFPINTKDIQDAPFIFHRIKYPKWEFKKVFGDKAVETQSYLDGYDDNSNSVEDEKYREFGTPDFMYDKNGKEYIVYECHYKDTETGELRITHLCGNSILLSENNTYGKYPFRIGTPVKLAHKIIGMSIPDLLKEIQKARTSLLRQIYDNAYLANHRRYFLDPSRVNLDDYLNNTVANAVIRTKGDPNGIVMPEQKASLPPEIFSFWEMLNTEKDYHGITPRSYQGVNPNVLNKTFRGQNQQITQAGKRLMMMARLFAEMFFKPLICDVIDLNLKFLSKKMQVRYLNDWVDINPDNIIGKFDVVVNVGLGTGNKDQTIIYMQQLMGLYAQIYKAGIPIVTAQNAYNAMKELVKAMGFMNTSDFVSNPQLTQSVGAFITNLMQKMAMAGVQDPQIQSEAMNIMSMIGGLPENKKGVNGRDFENQEKAASPSVAGQPANPFTTQSGGGYYA